MTVTMGLNDRSKTALRWSASLVEPLLTTTQRIRFDEEFRDLTDCEPKWFSAYCAGVLSGIVSSLPPSDPWRKVQVGADATPRWPDGHTFGAREDTDDVIQPIMELEDAGIDPTTLALESEVSADVGALVTLSFSGWRDGYEMLITTEACEGPSEAFDLATSAIRWALHRRRAYRPEAFDAWLDYLCIGWAGWADDASRNGLSPSTELEIERKAQGERDALAKIAEDLGFFA